MQRAIDDVLFDLTSLRDSILTPSSAQIERTPTLFLKMDNDPSEFLENLEFCNRERFNGMLMLANRTIHEFSVFVSQAIFDSESEAYRFVHTQKDIYPISDRENEFIIWSRLFKRYYELTDRELEDMEKRKNQESK